MIVDAAAGQPSGPPARPAAKRTLAEALESREYQRLRGELAEALFGQLPDRLTDEQSETLAAALCEAESAGITPVELERNCKTALRDGKDSVEARSLALREWIAERRRKAEDEATPAASLPEADAETSASLPGEEAEGPSQDPLPLEVDPGSEESQ